MADKAWKQCERRLAKLFGTVRRPLSGMNSRSGGRDDSQHPRLFIECKQRKYHPLWRLFLDSRALAVKENKTPVLGLSQSNFPGFLLVCHTDDFPVIAAELFAHNPDLYQQFKDHQAKITT